MKAKIERTTWITRHGYPDEKLHRGWSVTTPSAMGTTTQVTKSFREAMDVVVQYKRSKGKIDAQRKLINNYCSSNAWTRSGT